MLACLDVQYVGEGACAARVLFDAWTSAQPTHEASCAIAQVEPYEPGNFFKRELPCLLQVLREAPQPLDAIVLDGYVWLSADAAPGLGAHLFDALGGSTPVIGVAKTAFAGAAWAQRVLRPGSAKPLFVTAAGLDPTLAADLVRSMHGEHRIPTLLKRVDALARRGAREMAAKGGK